MDDLYFTWLPVPVSVDSSAYLPEFTLHRLSLYDCSLNYTQGKLILKGPISHVKFRPGVLVKSKGNLV